MTKDEAKAAHMVVRRMLDDLARNKAQIVDLKRGFRVDIQYLLSGVWETFVLNNSGEKVIKEVQLTEHVASPSTEGFYRSEDSSYVFWPTEKSIMEVRTNIRYDF